MKAVLGKLLSAFIILISSVQLSLGEVISRFPASQNIEKAKESYFKNIQTLNKDIKGSVQKQGSCEQKDGMSFNDDFSFADSPYNKIHEDDGMTDEEFFAEIRDRRKISCEYSYAPREEVVAPITPISGEDCVETKTDGLVDRVINKLKETKESNEVVKFTHTKSEFYSYLKRAKQLKIELEAFLLNSDIEDEQKRNLTLLYIQDVLIPLRDVLVLFNAGGEEFDYNKTLSDYFVSFDSELFSNTEDEKKLRLGVQRLQNPYELTILSNDESWSFQFNDFAMIGRDLSTRMKAPTLRSYLHTTKVMTLQMMMNQRKVYDVFLGQGDELIDVPKSCQTPSNGSFPSQLDIKIKDEVKENYLEAVIANLGYIESDFAGNFREYTVEYADSDAVLDGYSGMPKHEEYELANIYLDGKYNSTTRPQLDDVTHFDALVNAIFRVDIKNEEDVKLLQEVLATPGEEEYYEIMIGNEKDMIQPSLMNISKYLAKRMQRQGTVDVYDVVPQSVWDQLEKNEVKIDFPSINTTSFWRVWALNRLSQAVNDAFEDGHTGLERELGKLCVGKRRSVKQNQICSYVNRNSRVKKLNDFLMEYRYSENYIPVRKLKKENFDKVALLLDRTWKYLRDNTEYLDDAKYTEKEYLMSQLEAGNPWARIRLSLLVLVDDLVKVTIGEYQKSKHLSCELRPLSSSVGAFRKLMRETGLDQPLSPMYGDKIASDDARRFVWQDIKTKTNDSSEKILTATNSKGSLFQTFNYLSEEAILSRPAVEKFIEKNLDFNISNQAWDEVNDVFNSGENELATDLLDIFKAKGSLEKQEELFEKFSEKYDIDSSISVKEEFVTLENKIKKPLFFDAVKQAVIAKRLDLKHQMQRLCGLGLEDRREIVELFHSTAKVQNKINKQLGLPSIPEYVDDYISAWSKEEIQDLGIIAGMIVATVGVVLVGGSCIATVGATCAAFLLGAGTTGFGLQTWLASREMERYSDGNSRARFVQKMEDLGYAEAQAHEALEVSWALPAFETISILPFIGAVTRSIRLGGTVTKEFVKASLRNSNLESTSSKHLLRNTGGAVEEEVQTEFALKVLRMNGDENLTALKEVVAKSQQEIRDLTVAYEKRAITKADFERGIARIRTKLSTTSVDDLKDGAYEYTSRLTANYTKRELDSQTAKVVARYFGGDSKAMLGFLRSYDSRMLQNRRRLAQYKLRARKLRNNQYGAIKGFLVEARYGHQGRMASKLNLLTKRLAKESSENLEAFIAKNIEDFTDIFIDISSRKREWPYMILLQGGPHIGGILKGKRLAVLQQLADGIMLRKFFNARARLSYELARKEAREVLGLSTSVKQDSVAEVMKTFNDKVALAVTKLSNDEALDVITKYGDLQKVIANKAIDGMSERKLAKVLGAYDKSDVKRILFRPETLKELAVSDLLWKRVNTDELLGLSKMGEFSYQVVRTLSKYENVTEFQKYLEAMKILVVKKQKGIVEIM